MTPPDPSALLLSRGYFLRESWQTQDVLNFVRRELGHQRWPLLAFWSVCAMQLVMLILAVYRAVTTSEEFWFVSAVVPIGCGFASLLLLVPPHELIHGLMYKLLGASRVEYGANWRQLVFHASAPHLVLPPSGLTLVAIAPFILINTLLLVLVWRAEGVVEVALLAALLAHTQGCSGDFCMLNFLWRVRREGAWLTFDQPKGGGFQLWCKPGSVSHAQGL